MTVIKAIHSAVAVPKAADHRAFLWGILLGATLFGSGYLIVLERGSTYSIWSSMCIALSVYTVYGLFKQRMFMLGSLSLCLTYGVTVVWIANYVMELPMTSWRAGWESGYAFTEALGASMNYLVFFSVLSNVAMFFLPSFRERRHVDLDMNSYRMPVAALTGLSALALIAIAGTQGRNEYLLDADVGSKFLVQASSIMLATLFAFTLFLTPHGAYRNTINATLISVALLVGLNGFRFILIMFALIWFFHVLSTRQLSTGRVITLISGVVAGYFLLLILAYTRAAGMTFGEALSFAARPDLSAVFKYVGASEQTNLVAQDYYQGSDNLLSGRTYLDAFLRLAPNFIHTTFFDTIRSQDYIIETGSFVPEVFRERNWTIGSHLFVEAIINFGKIGPYLMLCIFAASMAIIEKSARNSHYLFLGYIVTAGMGYSLAWYGFTNTLKQGAFAFICGAIIIVAGKPYRRTARLQNRTRANSITVSDVTESARLQQHLAKREDLL